MQYGSLKIICLAQFLLLIKDIVFLSFSKAHVSSSFTKINNMFQIATSACAF
jgi:hypothetical protein